MSVTIGGTSSTQSVADVVKFGPTTISGGWVADTAANIAASLDQLNTIRGVSFISASDGLPLQITATQFVNDQTALSRMNTTGSSFDGPFNVPPKVSIAVDAGTTTISAGTFIPTITGGSFNPLVFGGTSFLTYNGGSGSGTVVGGSGGNAVVGNTVTGGSGTLLLFATGYTKYTGGPGAATIIGNGASLTADLGAGGGVAFGSSSGGNRLRAGDGDATIVGAATGDTLTLTGSGKHAAVAGAGAETIDASAATGRNVFFAGTGSDCIVGGAGDDLFVLGAGNATLTGGGGHNAYVAVAVASAAPRSILITDFDTTRNAVGLFGYGSAASADAAALASATLVAGSTNISLADGTRITFQGVTSLNSFNFF